jgi:DNA-binding MarR family transcriptional regulator
VNDVVPAVVTKAKFDDVIHAPNRLQICAFLMPIQDAEFQVLRDELEVSDSVLSKHLGQLEAAGYVKFRKAKMHGRQRMWSSMSGNGRRDFAAHVQELQRLISD